MDSVETVIRFRQSPPEGDITSVTISIVLNISTGYILKNGSVWWDTWVCREINKMAIEPYTLYLCALR